MVTGNIYLNCVKQFQCRGLHIDIHGEEKTHWVEERQVSVSSPPQPLLP